MSRACFYLETRGKLPRNPIVLSAERGGLHKQCFRKFYTEIITPRRGLRRRRRRILRPVHQLIGRRM